MAFSTQKKLAEIELKIDRILEMLEIQAKLIGDRENDNRQFLCELLDRKMIDLANENQRKIKFLEAELKDIESKISVLTEKGAEEIQDLSKDLEKRDNTLRKTLKSLKQEAVKQQRTGQALIEQLDLTENEIRMLLINSVMDQIPSCEDED